jgi:hypothetical protein
VWLSLDPRQGPGSLRQGLGERQALINQAVSAHHLRGAPGGGGLGDGLEGEGLVPDCLGWLRVVREPKKSLGCKRWVAIGLASLRFSP